MTVGHHVTASGPMGYLDPELRLRIHRCVHDEIHRLLRAAGLDDPAALLSDDPVGRTELRLRRLAATCAVVAEQCCSNESCAIRQLVLAIGNDAGGWADELGEALE